MNKKSQANQITLNSIEIYNTPLGRVSRTQRAHCQKWEQNAGVVYKRPLEREKSPIHLFQPL